MILYSLKGGAFKMESNRLKGDVAFVTGAASGIGKEIAIKFAINGAIVACVDINEKELQETVRTIHERGGEAFGIPLDLQKTAQVKKAMKEVFERTNKISILV